MEILARTTNSRVYVKQGKGPAIGYPMQRFFASYMDATTFRRVEVSSIFVAYAVTLENIDLDQYVLRELAEARTSNNSNYFEVQV